MATPEWQEADRWLHQFAESLGGTCTNYGDLRNPDGSWQEQVWRPITCEEVVQAGHDYAEGEDYFVQVGSEEARSIMADQETRARYWKAWQTVTGEWIKEDRQGGVFSCTC